jgi:hypothetical protein
MNRVLRPVITGRQAARFAPDQLAELVEVNQFRRGDAGFRQLRIQAERG